MVEIPYTPPANKLTISKTEYQYGETINFNITGTPGTLSKLFINANEAGGIVLSDLPLGAGKFTIPLSWMEKCTNANAKSAEIKLITFYNNSFCGVFNVFAMFSVPQNIQPVINTISLEDLNSNAKSLLGANNFLQSVSNLKMSGTVSGVYGSPIREVYFIIDGVKYLQDTNSLTRTFSPSSTGAKTVTISITDGRARTVQKSINYNVYPYTQPSITTFSASRISDTGVSVKTGGSFSPISVGGVNKNSITSKIEYKPTTSNSWILSRTDSTFGGFQLAQSFSSSSSFDIRLTVTDKIGSSYSQTTLSTAFTLIDLDGNSGIGVGKMHESGILDVSGNSRFNGDVYIGGAIESKLVLRSTDLNNITETGFYYNPANADVQTMKNVPAALSFSLLVEKHAGVKQTFTTFEPTRPRMFVRNFYGGTWTAWTNPFLDFIYPVGSIYMTRSTINPSSTFGGTWARTSKGRVLLGLDEGNANFNSPGKLGGGYDQDLFAAIGAVNNAIGSLGYSTEAPIKGINYNYGLSMNPITVTGINHSTTVRQGDGNKATTIQPYETVYIWQRTA